MKEPRPWLRRFQDGMSRLLRRVVSRGSADDSVEDMRAAAALDKAIDAVHQGTPIERNRILATHPQLAEALTVLARFHPPETPVAQIPEIDASVSVPERIGTYPVQCWLGSGHFGDVFKAYDEQVKRHVAVKLLRVSWLDQADCVSRFQREGWAAGRLRHRGIVELYQAHLEAPPFYLVTEFVEGVDPRAWCQQKGATFEQIAELVACIAEAVEHAHEHQVIHRDLKPENILVDGAGNPHILDFGLARLKPRPEDSFPSMTADGTVMGTWYYMAPEQASGRSHAADERSDVYSLGVILYELLCGRVPFLGPLHLVVPRIIDADPIPPRKIKPAIPTELEAVCLKAIEKKQDDRYQSAGALARDLRRFLSGDSVEAQCQTWVVWLFKNLDRRHAATLVQGWGRLAMLLGVVIFCGCALANFWEYTMPPGQRALPMFLTKLVQIGTMLWLAVRLRPIHERGLTAAERQIWALVPGYFGAYLALFLLTFVLPQPLPLAPILAVLSGMGFVTLGATIWGWFYVWGAAFFALALLISFCMPVGLLLLGLGWFVCLTIGSYHLYRTR